MLKKISHVINLELLYVLYKMGHGDEIVLVDAHFPAHSCNSNTIRSDGVMIDVLLDSILPLFELDTYVDYPLTMMSPAQNDTVDPEVERRFRAAIDRHCTNAPEIEFIDRFSFYERAKNAFAIIVTGEVVKYANIILKKGVTPV